MCFTRIYGFIFCDPKVINSSIDSINASYVIPTNRRLDVSVTGINYQEKNESDNTWSDKWVFDPKIFNGPDVLPTSEDAPIGVSAVTGTLTNAPFSFWSTFITTRAQRTESYRQQLALPWGNSESNKIAYRVCDNNSWRDWKYFPDENWINNRIYEKVMAWTNWAYLITLNSTNGYSVTLPNDWKEVYISTYLGASNSYVVPTYVIRRDTVELGDSTYALRTGYSTGGNNTESAQVIFGIGKQSITFLYAFKSGTDIKTTSNARVYVKLGYYFYDKVSDIDY